MSARILIIEDNPANLDLMSYLLRAFGHYPLLARDGEGGIVVARNERPDLILCDIQLPKMDGFELARRLRADSALSKIPLLAVTALAMVGDRDKILAAGFDGYVPMPIEPETFVTEVERFLADHLQPSRDAEFPRPRPLTPAPQATQKMFKILVVDNQPANRQLARTLLEPSGWEVIEAADCEEAVWTLKHYIPDLILSDVCMTKGSGYELVERVRGDKRLRSIPLILITSTLRNEEDRRRGLALGAKRFIFRPVPPELLLAEIEECLREAKGVN